MTRDEEEAFEIDGSLREIAVPRTDVATWQKLVDHVTVNYRTTTQRGDETVSLASAAEMFSYGPDEYPWLLVVELGAGLTAHAHFFDERSIRLDLDPREVQSSEAVTRVFAFAADLARALGRRVFLCGEDASRPPDAADDAMHAYWQYDPIDGARWWPHRREPAAAVRPR